jgi:hypothetical protein
VTYLLIPDFKHGLSRLRPQVAGLPSELWTAKNCVITRGGDVMAAKKWVGEYALPAGTFGLASVKGVPTVFGTAAAPGGLPPAVQYQRLTYSGSANLTKIYDAKPFSGSKTYVIAEFDDGDIRHFYNGAEVTDWRALADAAWDYTTVAKQLAQKINKRSDVNATASGNLVVVQALAAGTGFTISTSTTDNANVAGSLPTAAKTTLQANVAPVAEVRATATITITGGSNSPGVNYVGQVAVGANNLLTKNVDFVLDNSGTANAVALAITSAAVAGYSATAVGNVITILAPPGLGAGINGTSPVVTVGGNVTDTLTAFASGVAAVAAVQQIEQVAISATTPDTLDTWKITVNGTTYLAIGRGSATSTLIHTVARRVWCPVGSIVYFCKLSNPAVWSGVVTPSTDPGLIDTSQDSEGTEDIVSIAEHNGNTAFFSDTGIRIYQLNTDATLISLVQALRNTGSIARNVTLQYRNSDLYYVATTGLSAIRSRLGSNYSSVHDVGTAITSYLQDFVKLVGDSVALEAAAVIEPVAGLYMLGISNRIFALADYPETAVSGWTEIVLPFTIEQLVRIGRQVMARAGSTIYVYGGIAGNVYPAANELPVEVETYYLTASDPAGKKDEGGFDMAGAGTWYVEMRVDPDDTTKTVKVGNVSYITYPKGAIKVPVNTTHVAIHATCSTGGPCSLSNMALHYELGEDNN